MLDMPQHRLSLIKVLFSFQVVHDKNRIFFSQNYWLLNEYIILKQKKVAHQQQYVKLLKVRKCIFYFAMTNTSMVKAQIPLSDRYM